MIHKLRIISLAGTVIASIFGAIVGVLSIKKNIEFMKAGKENIY